MWDQQQQQQSGEQSSSQTTSEQPYVVATAAAPVYPTNNNMNGNPSQLNTPNVYGVIPPGWTTAIDSTDGRIYYLEVATGRASYTHPSFNTPQQTSSSSSSSGISGPGRVLNPLHPRSWNPFRSSQNNDSYPQQTLPPNNNNNAAFFGNTTSLDTPLNARSRPDTNQCYAFTSLLMCPPIGLIAMYHSLSCNRAWNQGRYSDAIVHSREAPKYAWFGCFIGGVFWIYFFFFRRESKLDWFEGWNWNFFGD